MSTEQHGADAYGQELARISQHQSEATAARFTVFQALAAVGIGHEQADDIVSTLEAGAHTWISESSAPYGSERRFEDGWHAGVRDVSSYLLRIANTTAQAQRGGAASSAMLLRQDVLRVQHHGRGRSRLLHGSLLPGGCGRLAKVGTVHCWAAR
ncbi:hypothetical protein ACFWOJ_34590 [Streptomyces sp. NPDC058439]|uniref:hypothetical protein n=1 Tax=Streptomyces sp. NPDC058439 TaxID=3346500 RepID=UPI00365150F5